MSSPTGNDKSGYETGSTLILEKKRYPIDQKSLKEAKDDSQESDANAGLHKLNGSLDALADNLRQIRDRLVVMNQMMTNRRHTEYAEMIGIDSKTIH